MGSYSHKRFACPFYKADRRKGNLFIVSCECGIVRLPGRATFNAYVDQYCCKDWKSCTMAQALKEYYEETPGH